MFLEGFIITASNHFKLTSTMSFLHHRYVCMLIKEENTEGDSTVAVSSSTGLTLFVFTYLGGGFLFYSELVTSDWG